MQHYASLLHWVVDALMHRRRVLFAVCCLLFARQKSITASMRNAGSACRISREFP
ncbi:hypothetical protein VDG37_12790 [Xanthomonas campestris pv. raphani]|uniref:hypothetical protein n=1 Tax=Xanthomonas campestris TaxID=339 RepID=UPI002B2299F3|nr:hypothetical protein [Xanthomonas campestris]MEA9833131.1 hypothetical protein [Xanthomonas campestris pv. raphani]MEA9953594.1 hypothetical protein [Xanthomonas campestris pv. raphani]